MRKPLLEILKCPVCGNSGLSLDTELSDAKEIKSGRLVCGGCQNNYRIEGGIINFLDGASCAVTRERMAMDAEDYISDADGNKYRITQESIDRFKDKFLSLPEGDGSYLFKKGGSFQSTAEAADRFYCAMEDLHLSGRERILEIGAAFSYASAKFAQKGCDVVAVDISNYLKVADLYTGKAYFERIFADMHKLPFADNTFDIVFGSAVLHHSKNIKEVFSQIHRVLAPGGKLVLINEAARGIMEKIHHAFKELEAKGYGDTSYTVIEFKKGAREGGFEKIRIVFSSLASDYVTKHRNRGSRPTILLKLAYFFKKHRKAEGFILLFLIIPRLLFRPKSWKLICQKKQKQMKCKL